MVISERDFLASTSIARSLPPLDQGPIDTTSPRVIQNFTEAHLLSRDLVQALEQHSLAVVPGVEEENVNWTRTFNIFSTKGFWDAFWLRLCYADAWEEGSRTVQQVRVILNFPIPLLWAYHEHYAGVVRMQDEKILRKQESGRVRRLYPLPTRRHRLLCFLMSISVARSWRRVRRKETGPGGSPASRGGSGAGDAGGRSHLFRMGRHHRWSGERQDSRPGQRVSIEAGLPGRKDGQEGRSPLRNRPQALQGGPRPGRGPTSHGQSQTGQDGTGCEALHPACQG